MHRAKPRIPGGSREGALWRLGCMDCSNTIFGMSALGRAATPRCEDCSECLECPGVPVVRGIQGCSIRGATFDYSGGLTATEPTMGSAEESITEPTKEGQVRGQSSIFPYADAGEFATSSNNPEMATLLIDKFNYSRDPKLRDA